jgi:hypothetical protein
MPVRSAVLLLALTACSGASESSRAPSESSSDAGSPGAPDARRDATPDAGVDVAVDVASPPEAGDANAPQAITVSGRAVDQSDKTKPLVGRTVVLVDATEKPFWTMTSATGAFTFSGVLPPYDVVVAAPSWPGGYRFAFVGVSTKQPRVFGWSDAAPVYPASHEAGIAVAVGGPACGTNPCVVDLSLADFSKSGSGFAGTQQDTYSTPGPNAWFVQGDWSGASTLTDFGVNVLVSDSPAAHFWYGQYSGGTVTDGQWVPTPQVSVSPIATLGSVTVNLTSMGLPQQWPTPELELKMDYPASLGEGWALLSATQSAFSVSVVPDIVGATLEASAYAATDPNKPDPNYRARTEAYARNLPLGTANVAVTLYGPPTVTHPQPGGALSATGVVDWTNMPPQQIMMADIGDQASDEYEVEVYTSGSSIDLKRLAAAGVSISTGPKFSYFMPLGNVTSLDDILDESVLAWPDGAHDEVASVRFTATP